MHDIGKINGVGRLNNNAGIREARRLRRVTVAVMAALLLNLIAAGRAEAQDEVDYHKGGSIMEYASVLGGSGLKTYLIFWQPTATKTQNYPFVLGGGPADILFQDTITQFFLDLSRQSRNQRGGSVVRRYQSCREPDDGIAHGAL